MNSIMRISVFRMSFEIFHVRLGSFILIVSPLLYIGSEWEIRCLQDTCKYKLILPENCRKCIDLQELLENPKMITITALITPPKPNE